MTKGVRAVPKRPRVRLAEVGHITGQQRQALSWPEIKQRTTMSKSTFFLVSLPTSISQSNDRDEALTALRSVVSTDNGTTYPFSIPSFKIGTLDALVQQADDLQKLEQGCKGVVEKVADSLKNILEGDEDKIADQKNVNDKPVDHYLQSFQWNKVKYRAEKPISELVDMLQKVSTLFIEVVALSNRSTTGHCQHRQRRQDQVQPVQLCKDFAGLGPALAHRQPFSKVTDIYRQPGQAPRTRRFGIPSTTLDRRPQEPGQGLPTEL